MTLHSILITGVSSGIGFATARRFLDQGWRVIGTIRKPDDADQLKDLGGENFSRVTLDVTDLDRIVELAGEVAQLLEGKPLDVLCNNAGTSGPAATASQSVTGHRSAVELSLIADLTHDWRTWTADLLRPLPGGLSIWGVKVSAPLQLKKLAGSSIGQQPSPSQRRVMW